MTQAQLTSAAKRINQQLVQTAKTFGRNSQVYKNLSDEIQVRFGDHTHVTKSGHIAISTGKHLQQFEHQLNVMDRLENKVAYQVKQAKKYIQQTKGKKAKISKSEIKQHIENKAIVEDFFDNKLGDFYALRHVNEDIDNILKQLETGGQKKSYEELTQLIDELNRLKEEYESQLLTPDEVEQERSRGKLL